MHERSRTFTSTGLMRTITLIAAVGMAMALPTTEGRSAVLTASFGDPTNDWAVLFGGPASAPIDLTSLVLTVDNTTGAYSIVLDADVAHPFVGFFRINANLYNSQFTTSTPGLLIDNRNDFTLATPTASMSLSGINSNILSWQAGDRIVVSGPDPLGIPIDATFSSFGSGVNVPGGDFPIPSTDPVFQDLINPSFAALVAQTTTVPAPEPASLGLLGAAVTGLSIIRFRRKRGARR
jgi:hypothetical protein